MMNYNPKILINDEDQIVLIDDSENTLENRKIERILRRYNSYFLSRFVLREDLSYIEVNDFIKNLNIALNKIYKELEIDNSILDYIKKNQYLMEEHVSAGLTIKSFDLRWEEELIHFKEVLDKETIRQLKYDQSQASFYLTIMERAGNFSVPGSGKTAMMYGAFAYLSSKEVDKIDKIFVISPLMLLNHGDTSL